jgi:2-dehydro-3-deoxygluconokinase
MENKTKVLFVGEAMLELVNTSENMLAKSYAGDVYNTSVYMKRAYPNLNASFLSAVGQDLVSQEFVQKAKDEKVNTQAIGISERHHLGTYMVVNDHTGERSFIYWRSDSAAKSMMSTLSSEQNAYVQNEFGQHGVIFFSGITIAIMHPSEREQFWELLQRLQQAGALVVFDPNYRPALWENSELAKQETEKAFALSDWLMPGVDDFKSLYGMTSVDECLEFCQQFSFSELVLKQGEKSVHVVNGDGHFEFEIVKSTNVVDTTSAGDAFNGIYLGARLEDSTPEVATKLANYAASKVIETPGAIMPSELFAKHWANKPN